MGSILSNLLISQGHSKKNVPLTHNNKRSSVHEQSMRAKLDESSDLSLSRTTTWSTICGNWNPQHETMQTNYYKKWQSDWKEHWQKCKGWKEFMREEGEKEKNEKE